VSSGSEREEEDEDDFMSGGRQGGANGAAGQAKGEADEGTDVAVSPSMPYSSTLNSLSWLTGHATILQACMQWALSQYRGALVNDLMRFPGGQAEEGRGLGA
jgi:hypothetical protein